MSTEYEGDDVLIVADSFDTTNHNQDGYVMKRFINTFTYYDFFPEDHLQDKYFIAVKSIN